MLGFSEAMMLDHRYEGVKVTTILPGSVNTEFGRGGQADWKIAPEDVAEVVADGEGAQGSNGIDEEGVGAVEGVDVAAAVGGAGPAGGLDGAGDLEGEFVEVLLAVVVRDFSFAHQAQQVAIGGHIVETVIVHAHVREVRGHARVRFRSA